MGGVTPDSKPPSWIMGAEWQAAAAEEEESVGAERARAAERMRERRRCIVDERVAFSLLAQVKVW